MAHLVQCVSWKKKEEARPPSGEKRGNCQQEMTSKVIASCGELFLKVKGFNEIEAFIGSILDLTGTKLQLKKN